jgi:hypothetical protein
MAGNFAYGSTLSTPAGLLSYPKIFKPEASTLNPSAPPKYSCSILIPKNGPSIDNLVNECKKVAAELFGNRFTGRLNQFGDKQPIKDGDNKGENDPAFGHWIFNANTGTRRKPWVFDRFNKPITDEEEIYGGAIGILWVQPIAYDMDGIKGVKLALEGVQKLADGDPFQKRWNPAEACTTVADVPDYLKGRVATARPSFGPRDDRSSGMAPHEAALITALKTTPAVMPNGADDDLPF